MIKLSHRTLYAISGIVWLAVGLMLVNLGLGFIMQGHPADGYTSFFTSLAESTGRFEYAAILVIGVGLIAGVMKGRFVMQKNAHKTYTRISQLENPTSIANLYTRQNLIILAAMMCLGMLMKYLSLPLDVRGFIDTAVGCALIQGSLAYFRFVPN